MIDQKGRLFGKVNIIDLLVLLAVLGVAGWFGYKVLAPEKPVGDQTVEVEFLVGPVRQATVDVLQVTNPPTPVYDGRSGAYLGDIVAVRTEKATILGDNGEYKAETRFDHFITVRGTGVASEAGTSLGGVPMLVGAQPIKTPLGRNDAVVWKIGTKPAGK